MGGIRAWQKSVRESSQVWSDHERGRVGVSRRRNEEAEVNDEPLDEVAHIERSRGSGEEGDLVEVRYHELAKAMSITDPSLANFHHECNAPSDEHQFCTSRLR